MSLINLKLAKKLATKFNKISGNTYLTDLHFLVMFISVSDRLVRKNLSYTVMIKQQGSFHPYQEANHLKQRQKFNEQRPLTFSARDDHTCVIL